MKFTTGNTEILRAIQLHGSNLSTQILRRYTKPKNEDDPAFMSYMDFLLFGSNPLVYYYTKSVRARAVEFLSNPAIISELCTVSDCGLILINKTYSVFFRLDAGGFTSILFNGLRIAKYASFKLDDPMFDLTMVREQIEQSNGLNQLLPLPLLALYHFAEVEVRIINNDRKKVKMGSEVIFNSNKSLIRVIDSSYFTKIIRTEGFAVRGHFAIRRRGPGRSERRLTWIKPHAKNGYTRKAKLESLNDHDHPGFKAQNKFPKLAEQARNLGCICTPGSQSSSCPAIEKRACIHGEDFLEEMLEGY
jgi:hypothetical protein